MAGNGLRLHGLTIDKSIVIDVEILQADDALIEIQTTMLRTDALWHVAAVSASLANTAQQKLASIGIPTYYNICIVHTFVINTKSFIFRSASFDTLI